MSDWWDSLPLISQIMYFIAIPSTILLLIQLVFSFIGGEDADGDAGDIDDVPDVDPDATDFSEMDEPPPNSDNDTDLNFVGIFTFRSIVAFLASFSWSSLALYSAGIDPTAALVIGFVIGIAMMFAVAKIVEVLLKLSENGTVRFSEAIGKTGEVYIPIPAARQGEGKILIDFQGAKRECSAQTESEEVIPTGKRVYVTGFSGEILIVESVAE
jgi:membrane protein implicated in regulation of membrane protease activity